MSTPRCFQSGFSLVEIALALGLASFALLALLGLFSVGVQAVGNSQRNVEAANVLSTVLETRLAAPSNANAVDVLPALSADVLPLKGTAYLGATGHRVAEADARFRLTYEIWEEPASIATAETRLLRVHLLLSWPALANTISTGNFAEIFTSVYVAL